MYEFLTLDIAEGVGTITLNRPEVYNAFNDGLSFEMHRVLKEVSKNDEIRVVVITGAGKAFCSGQDLKDSSKQENKSFSDSVKRRYNPMIKGIVEMPKPVIAKVNGVAAGAGASLALACDLIVMAEEAQLIEVFVNIGLVMDSGSSFFLPRLVSSVQAFEYATMGTRITAAKALELGMVNKIAPLEKLDETLDIYTSYYAKAPTRAIGLMKKMLQKSQHSTLSEMLDYEAYCQEIAGKSADYKEGVQAFIEKRKPEFKGR